MTTPEPLRVVIVDDEAIARRRLRRLLGRMAGVVVAGEAAGGATALDVIRDTAPDVVVLDVQMPGPDGFAVARQLPAGRPLVVFVTAWDRYAVQAFEIHALDYLLKPVSEARLASAIRYARGRLAAGPAERSALDARLAALLERVAGPSAPIEPLRLPVRTRGRVALVDVADVEWIEAAGNYVVLHAGREAHLLRDTVSGLARRLASRGFVRIHRSSIVRLDAVVRLESAGRGDYVVVLRSGARALLSRTFRPRLERVLGRRL